MTALYGSVARGGVGMTSPDPS